MSEMMVYGWEEKSIHLHFSIFCKKQVLPIYLRKKHYYIIFLEFLKNTMPR